MHDRTTSNAMGRAGAVAVAILLVLPVLAGLGCGRAGSPGHVASLAFSVRRLDAATAPARFFSPHSIWNEPLARGAAIDPRSQVLIDALNSEIARERDAGGGPGINTTEYSVPIYTVPAGQPTVRVRLVARSPEPALQRAWNAVPLPEDAQPAAGTDKHLVVWQPSTDRLWEFWRLERDATGWEAGWGGAIRHVSTSRGVYGPRAWPGAQRSWGASASSLSIVGGLITLEDLERGTIDHVLAMSVPQVLAGSVAAPAQRTDGASASRLSLPEGAHLRLDPTLNLVSLHLPKLSLIIARAAQRYGIVVRDRASHVTLYAQDPTGADPYQGLQGYFHALTPTQLLASFPWNRLKVLHLNLHRLGGGSRH